MKKSVSIALATAFVLSLAACNAGVPENALSETSQTVSEASAEITAAPITAAEAAETVTTAVTEPPVIDDGYLHYKELKFNIPEKYEDFEEDEDIYVFYQNAYIYWDEEQKFAANIDFESRSKLYLDGYDWWTFYRPTKSMWLGYSDVGYDGENFVTDITIDGIVAEQDTSIFKTNDNYYIELFSTVTLETETTVYKIDFFSRAEDGEEKVNNAFEDFNKMISEMKIAEDKLETKAFDDDIKSLVRTPGTDGYHRNLGFMEFDLPDEIFGEEYCYPNQVLNLIHTGDTAFSYRSRLDGNIHDWHYDCAFYVMNYTHETVPLFENCTEERFRQLTDSELLNINIECHFINNDKVYGEKLPDAEKYSIRNIKRLEVDGYPAVYFENQSGFSSCMIIYTEEACRVLRINNKELMNNKNSKLRYSDYIYGSLKITNPDVPKADTFNDDLGSFLSDKTAPEEQYLYYRNLGVPIPEDYTVSFLNSRNAFELVKHGNIYPSIKVSPYAGFPIELMDKKHLDGIVYSDITMYLNGKFKGYNCVIVRMAENTENTDRVLMFIDAGELGSYKITVTDEATILEAKELLSSVKIIKDSEKPKTDYSGSIDKYVIRKDYKDSEIECIAPHYLHAVPYDGMYLWTSFSEYRTKGRNLKLYIDDIQPPVVCGNTRGYYIGLFRQQYISAPKDVVFTKIDGCDAVLLVGNSVHVLYIYGAKEDNYKLTITAENPNEETNIMIKEFLGSIRIREQNYHSDNE